MIGEAAARRSHLATMLVRWKGRWSSVASPASESTSHSRDSDWLPSRDDVRVQYDHQGLFVIGAARSGTTVLQNALNDSRAIFLFGEPAFHDDAGGPDFASRY